MNDVPFDKRFDISAGVVDEVRPGIRRLLAPNPGPFTFTGTLTYILGERELAIIDPGPEDQSHIAALLQAIGNTKVTHIFVTHTHRDHSPATAAIKAATGAIVLAEGPHRAARTERGGDGLRLDASGDYAFRPDRMLTDGEVVHGKEWSLEAVFTPGHTANHMAYALRGTEILFSGDHVMGWSTTVVAPPDGNMRDYMNALAKLRERPEKVYLPGHGPAVRDAPRFVGHLLQHRKAREAAILRQISSGATHIPAIVDAIYQGLDARLKGAAALSVLAHIEDLVERGMLATEGAPALNGAYRLAAG